MSSSKRSKSGKGRATDGAEVNGSPFGKLKPALPENPAACLSFGLDNSKLPADTAAFSLPAGYTCPGACDCLAWFDRDRMKIVDGPKAQYRCFAASMEAAFSTVRKAVDNNLALLKQAKTEAGMASLIDMSLPARRFSAIRVHADGDFFSQAYFLAWMRVARENPQRVFYAYTKNLPVWVRNRDKVPDNFVLTASQGGKWDAMIEGNGLRKAVVVYHPDEAFSLGLEIDHDDSHARRADGRDFALLLHGTQPKDSEAAAALKRMRDEGVEFSYSRKKKVEAEA